LNALKDDACTTPSGLTSDEFPYELKAHAADWIASNQHCAGAEIQAIIQGSADLLAEHGD
jgi:hypothetical protein